MEKAKEGRKQLKISLYIKHRSVMFVSLCFFEDGEDGSFVWLLLYLEDGKTS